MNKARLLAAALLSAGLGACSDSAPTENTQVEDAEIAQFGTETSRRYTVVADQSKGLVVPRGLAFDPADPKTLWVVNRVTEGTVIIYNAGLPNQKSVDKQDSHRSHFMSQVSSIAMGANGTFATCQENPQNFMGPALWPRDTMIYAKVNQAMVPPGQHNHNEPHLGSHLDMLHESPNCMGIVHDHNNVFWVFDGMHGAIVRYDFQNDHGPGFDDHSDGIVRRYTDAVVSRVAGVPSHLALDKASGWLYVADTGNRKIIRLDTRSGQAGTVLPKAEPSIREHISWTGARVETFISTGLTQPSGIVIAGDRLFVGDHATGEIAAYDMTGKQLARIKTPARAIMGLTIGPDGRLWYTDGIANEVVRIDP